MSRHLVRAFREVQRARAEGAGRDLGEGRARQLWCTRCGAHAHAATAGLRPTSPAAYVVGPLPRGLLLERAVPS